MNPRACAVPEGGLLAAYLGAGETYTDCFETVVQGEVDLTAFIRAFYTTWLFRLERLVLSIGRLSWIRDAEVAALASGWDSFAVWSVEARRQSEILLCDRSGVTRSYLSVEPAGQGATRLLFGSAVVAEEGKPLPAFMRALLPLHKIYAKALLKAAARKLQR